MKPSWLSGRPVVSSINPVSAPVHAFLWSLDFYQALSCFSAPSRRLAKKKTRKVAMISRCRRRAGRCCNYDGSSKRQHTRQDRAYHRCWRERSGRQLETEKHRRFPRGPAPYHSTTPTRRPLNSQSGRDAVRQNVVWPFLTGLTSPSCFDPRECRMPSNGAPARNTSWS